MPSNKKRRVRARREKTGESYAAALRNVRRQSNGEREVKSEEPSKPWTPPAEWPPYTGTPNLPPTTRRTFMMVSDDGRIFQGESHSEVEFEHVDIQGEFDPTDLNKAWVPSTAFYDPAMPRDPSWPDADKVKRVLSLKEYIEARTKQTGWHLDRIDPGEPLPTDLFPLLFTEPLPQLVLNVILVWRTTLESAGG